jgi:hypothetical protein
MTQFRFQGLISARLSPDTPNGDGDTVRQRLRGRQGTAPFDPREGERLYSRLLRNRKVVSTELDDGGVAKW